MLVNFENLEVVDYLRSGALIIAFIAVFLADRKSRNVGSVWIKADVITVAAHGVGWYLFPSQVIAYMTSVKVDVIHELMGRQHGAAMIGLALMWRHYSDDRTPQTAWLLIRSLGMITLAQLLMFAQISLAGQKVHLTDQNVTFNLLMIALMLFGSLYHLLKRANFGSVRRSWTTEDPTTVHLLIDILIVLPIGLSMLLMTDFWLSLIAVKDFKPDVIHKMMAQIFGLLMVLTRVLGLMSLGFPNDKDRRVVFFGYLWATVLTMPWGIFAQVKYQVHTQQNLIVAICVGLVPLFNALIACGCLPSPAKLFRQKRD